MFEAPTISNMWLVIQYSFVTKQLCNKAAPAKVAALQKRIQELLRAGLLFGMKHADDTFEIKLDPDAENDTVSKYRDGHRA